MNAFGITDIGLVRRTNQDTCCYEMLEDASQALFVVCDGMGGAQAGNVASTIASSVFCAHVREHIRQGMSDKYMRSILENAVRFANYEIYTTSKKKPECDGMGTTLVGGFSDGGHFALANVGDSRAYLIRGEEIMRLTRDHSLVEEMLLRGDITEEEARGHPRRNLITRALGTDERVEADLYIVPYEAQDLLLLCSDGLSGLLSDREMCTMAAQEGTLEERCRRLVDAARDRGGFDNITAVLISAQGGLANG